MSITNSKTFVCDCSVLVSILLSEESNKTIQSVKELLKNQYTLAAPSLLHYEISNVLLTALKRKRLETAEVKISLNLFSKLPIETYRIDTTANKENLILFAEKLNLSIYDTAYLELSKQLNQKLATLDKDLIKAAKKEKIDLI